MVMTWAVWVVSGSLVCSVSSITTSTQICEILKKFESKNVFRFSLGGDFNNVQHEPRGGENSNWNLCLVASGGLMCGQAIAQGWGFVLLRAHVEKVGVSQDRR